jgi:hypothetical protein
MGGDRPLLEALIVKANRLITSFVTSILVLTGIVTPVSASDGTTLAGLIQSATGIARTYSPQLEALAQTRAVEIQSNFNHRAMPELAAWNWGEIIARNKNASDPFAYAVQQWLGSPPHRSIMFTTDFHYIGCGHSVNGSNEHFFVCLFGTPGGWSGGGQQQPPIANEIPDTAMENPSGKVFSKYH